MYPIHIRPVTHHHGHTIGIHVSTLYILFIHIIPSMQDEHLINYSVASIHSSHTSCTLSSRQVHACSKLLHGLSIFAHHRNACTLLHLTALYQIQSATQHMSRKTSPECGTTGDIHHAIHYYQSLFRTYNHILYHG